MTSKVFSSGTVIDSAWLNDVNNVVYGGGGGGGGGGGSTVGTLPPGGTTGQVPLKNSSADYDVSWATLPTITPSTPATTFYNATLHGVTGDGTTDDTTALQACIDYVCANGGCLYLPKGKYKISAPLTFQCVLTADPHKRPSMLGDGIGATVIQQTTNNNGIVIAGASADPSVYGEFKGFSLYGSTLGGSGISIGSGAFCSLAKVYLAGWEIGLYGVNALSSQFRDVVMRFNNAGFRFEANTSYAYVSEPNAITMEGCTASNNLLYGGYVIGAGTFNYIGGSIEGNGAGTDLSSSKWGLHITNAGGNYAQQAASGFNIQGVYFENNGGKAHLWVDQTATRVGMSAVVSGCSFVSLGPSYPSSFVYLGASSLASAFPISFIGCGWAGLDGYTPSAGRPTITNTSDYFKLALTGCSFYSSVDQYKQGSPNRYEGSVECVSYRDLAGTVLSSGGGGSGDVVGPASAVDNALTRFDTTTGKLIQSSTVSLGDTGIITFPTSAKLVADMTSSNGFAVQTSVANTATSLAIIPNGTGVGSGVYVGAGLDQANTRYTSISASTAGSYLTAGAFGTGTAAPLEVVVGGATRYTYGLLGQLGIGASNTTGTAGQVLTSGGASAAPSWTSPVTSLASSSSSSGLTLSASGSTGNVTLTLAGTPSTATTAANLSGSTLSTSSYTLSSSNTFIALASNTGHGVFVSGSAAFAPDLDNTFTCGGPTNRWAQVYAASGSINTSDGNQKTELMSLTAAELRVATSLAKKVGTYKFLDSVAKKREEARTHIGLIAQQVVACFKEEGLDPFAYGMVCFDEGVYGLRYEELTLFITRGQEARIAALEALL